MSITSYVEYEYACSLAAQLLNKEGELSDREKEELDGLFEVLIAYEQHQLGDLFSPTVGDAVA